MNKIHVSQFNDAGSVVLCVFWQFNDAGSVVLCVFCVCSVCVLCVFCVCSVCVLCVFCVCSGSLQLALLLVASKQIHSLVIL